jgi:catechol 2,3-dioxygenase-like lactoylglutathione lyase family enzyme
VDQRLSFVTLGSRDREASRRFYRDGLGWTPVMDIDEITFFQVAPGVVLGVWTSDELAADGARPWPEVSAAPSGFALASNVASEAEVDAAVGRVVAAGGTVLKPGQQAEFGGYHAYVADPDGVRWEIAYNPGWHVDDEGNVTLS